MEKKKKEFLTKYFYYTIIGYLKNPYILFWALGFMSFWAAMAAFVFSKNVPADFADYNFAMVYSQLLVLCVGSVAIGIVETMYYSSFSIRFFTKFSKLNSRRFVFENALSTIIVLIIYSLALLVIQSIFFNIKFGEFYAPKLVGNFVVGMLLSAMVIYLFSLVLAYIPIAIAKPKIKTFMAYIPLILGFIVYAAFWVDLKYAVFFIPLNIVSLLTYYAYTGEKPYTGDLIGNMIAEFQGKPTGTKVEPTIMYATAIVWIIVLAIVAVVLIQKARGVSIEELRLA